MSDLFATPNEAAESIGVAISVTTKEDIHTEESILGALGNIMVCNPTGGAITLDLWWYDGTTEYQLWSNKSFATNENAVITMGALSLRRNHVIRAQASAAGLVLVLNMAETAGRVR